MEPSAPRVATRVVETLSDEGSTLALAESCTGGLAASMVTDVPGASAIFDRGFVTYSNQAKVEELGVKVDVIEDDGAVAAAVAEAMAEGARGAADADWAAATTGILGPTGGSEAKPEGTVYVGVAGPGGTSVQRYGFDGERREVKEQSARQMLVDLLEMVRAER
ncbi:CinA family protein [Thermoplasmatales archaeon SW_10_69_26]|nr:MAG: CinA family protein [Thermoplasmatales archaeon SW_10_69_26]